jgi:hypothetical protein
MTAVSHDVLVPSRHELARRRSKEPRGAQSSAPAGQVAAAMFAMVNAAVAWQPRTDGRTAAKGAIDDFSEIRMNSHRP